MEAADKDMPARAALRELLWRVEHMRLLLLESASAVDPATVRDLLDTSEARRVLNMPE